jgi:hypothetical protein
MAIITKSSIVKTPWVNFLSCKEGIKKFAKKRNIDFNSVAFNFTVVILCKWKIRLMMAVKMISKTAFAMETQHFPDCYGSKEILILARNNDQLILLNPIFKFLNLNFSFLIV